jgi:hypothetical protein
MLQESRASFDCSLRSRPEPAPAKARDEVICVMASDPHPEQRHGEAVARVEGRTAAIPLADPQACRLAAALVALTALTAISLTILGTLP